MTQARHLFGVLLSICSIASGCAVRQTSPSTAPAPSLLTAPAGAASTALPGTAASPAVAPGAALRVEVGPGGQLTVDGTPLGAPDLGQRVRASGQVVTVMVSPGAPQSALAELLAELRRAGATRVDVSFLPEPAPAGSSPAGPAAPSTLPAPSGPALPELTVKTVGMHIGGGPNDDQTKNFFRQRLEARFEDFRRCYPLVDEPGKGGTFGADLAIGRDGGKPKVRQPRTGLGGTGFHECMVGVLSSIAFPKPPRGPTVISYSIRFSVGGK